MVRVWTAMQEPQCHRRFKDSAWHGGLAAVRLEQAEHKKLIDSLFHRGEIVKAGSPDILRHRRRDTV